MICIWSGIANGKLLLVNPFAVTLIDPLHVPSGTTASISALVQLTADALTPPKETVLLPWFAPNPLPAIDTVCPEFPDDGVTEVIVGPEYCAVPDTSAATNIASSQGASGEETFESSSTVHCTVIV
jgi:hypothetical protein